ncbi:zinc-dependent peptidase [Aliikangiella sp. G2MR2-5]|uniref:M90 family metallopeptidase n=1 Tax=Aliikangiella sp. G2MR2-5 TaxID=2788943 RepID=UPI001AEEDAE8|nr:M90 family metallopeptidase [Aliikangiella sp. G2MR2-5]
MQIDTPIVLLLLIPAALITFIVFRPKWDKWRRQKVAETPFPKSWRQILRKNVPYFYRMPADLQLQLKDKIQIFLDEKEFYGFEGLEITDEIRVTIAAQACLLILNRDIEFYPKLKSIYVYPMAFVAKHKGVDSAGVLQEHHRVLSGESWELGKVILSWKDSKEGGLDQEDGHNVIIHEFAHQLDQATGAANGAPFLANNSIKRWSEVFQKEFENLECQIRKGHKTLIDPYGATNPAEFFAVSSEVFFERTFELKQQHPDLYKELKDYYQLDPSVW